MLYDNPEAKRMSLSRPVTPPYIGVVCFRHCRIFARMVMVTEVIQKAEEERGREEGGGAGGRGVW